MWLNIKKWFNFCLREGFLIHSLLGTIAEFAALGYSKWHVGA